MAGPAKSRAQRGRAHHETPKASKQPKPPLNTAAKVTPAVASPAGVRVWETQSKVLPSGVVGSKVSEHDEAFTLKQLIHTEGPLAGHRILVVVKKVTFLDLPAELRNQIWDLVLEKDMTFFIGSADHLHHGDISERLSRTRTSLARTNRQISAEVLSIVYGSNTVHFSTLARFAAFVDRKGDPHKHLRNVGIMNRNAFLIPPSLAEPWSSLQSLTSLQRLTLNHESLLADGCKTRLTELFNCLKPFLQAWHEANKDQRGAVRMSELIKFTKLGDLCLSCYFHDDDSQCDECNGLDIHLMKVSERLRELIAEEFGLEE